MSLSFNLSLPTVRETSTEQCTTPEDVVRQFDELKQSAQECFVSLTLNTKNHIIDKHLISLGTLNASLAHPREIFRPAITDGAAAIIVAHNHPSGDPTPSPEDIRMTRQIVEAGKIIEIPVIDHIIIGRKSAHTQLDYVSLRETGMVTFTA